jgi:hypothetical protein
MARRKQATAEAVQVTPTEVAAPQAAEIEQTAPDQSDGEAPARQYRPNPYPIKTANLDGYKVQLQESRPEGKPWQMQIKFGDGSLDNRPSDAVVDFIKSHKVTVETQEGPKEVNQFRWNDQDRAWAMRIDYDAPATSRQKAERVFDAVVEMVAEERGVGRAR